MESFWHVRPFSRTLIPLAAATGLMFGSSPQSAAPDAREIVRKSVEATKTDWAQSPKYSYVERDVTAKRGSKTFRVLMIDGSPYNLVTAVDDRPLPTSERALEERKLEREVEKRQKESERERQRRVAKYNREREHDHQMLQGMVDAFQFRLSGEAQMDGHDCWILDAQPRPDYEPTNHEGRVMKGMKGRLWVDKASYQWVKVHAEVVRPVSFYGFLAKVGPGTDFELEQAPVAGGVWMPTAFRVNVHASALGFVSENSSENDTYRDYQPMPQVSALLQSTK